MKPDDFPMLATARGLGPRLEEAADRIDRDCRLPDDLANALADAGLFKLLVPENLGGSELTPVEYLRVIEELARWNASAAWTVALICCNGATAGFLPPEIAHEMFADPRAAMAGSLAPTLRPPDASPNRAVVVDDGFRLSGSWSFASGCMHARWLQCLCAVHEGSAPRMLGSGIADMRWFHVPVGRLAIVEDWNTLGLRGTGSNRFVIDNVFVPHAYTLPMASPIEPTHPGTLYSFTTGSMPDEVHHYTFAAISKATLVGVMLGAVRGMMDAYVAHATSGPGAYLRNKPLVQDRLGQAEARLRAARAYMTSTLGEAWRAHLEHGRRPAGALMRLALVGTHTADMLSEAADIIWRTAGITAALIPGGFERRYRDLHTATQNGALTQGVYARVGRGLLGV